MLAKIHMTTYSIYSPIKKKLVAAAELLFDEISEVPSDGDDLDLSESPGRQGRRGHWYGQGVCDKDLVDRCL
jgi:hypothetical protein